MGNLLNLLVWLVILGLIVAAIWFILKGGSNLIIEGEENGYTSKVKFGLVLMVIFLIVFAFIVAQLEMGVNREAQKQKHQEFFEDQEEFLKEHGYQYGGYDRRIMNYPIDEE